MNLTELRKEIDAIDDKIVALINDRCKIASKVGAWKKKRAHAIYVPEREKQLFERLHGKNEGPISSSALRSIYREIISGAIALESPLKIICLDSPENSQKAARETFGDAAEYLRSTQIASLMKALVSEQIDYGVIPLADKSGNYSKEVIEELLKYKDIKICAERIGSMDGTGGRYFIIGPQETTASAEDRTAITIESQKKSSDWLKEIKCLLNGVEIFTAIEIESGTNAEQTVFIEFEGHPSDETIKKLLKDLTDNIGKIKVLGGYPVLYA